MEKSYVSMEQKVCLVCANPFDTGNILLDKRLKASMDMQTLTGIGLCPEHERLHNEGYCALVVVDHEKSTVKPDGTIDPCGAYRVGPIFHLRRHILKDMLTIDPTEVDKPMLFIDEQTGEFFRKMHESVKHE